MSSRRGIQGPIGLALGPDPESQRSANDLAQEMRASCANGVRPRHFVNTRV